MIGVNLPILGIYRQKTIQEAIAEGANIYTDPNPAVASQLAKNAGNVLLQGNEKAPAAMADAATGLLPPPIPGGAVMEKEVVVYQPATPVRAEDL